MKKNLTLATVPVFEYTFPDSYNGTSSTIVDQSAAGNNGTMDTTGGYLAGDRPSAFSTGGSITGAAGGHGVTNAIDLLDNTLVQANGGFTFDVWFQWEGTYTNSRKIIDYAGTENLRTNNSKIEFAISNNATVLSADIVGGQWYHAVAEFDTLGNTIDGSGDIAGEVRLWLDGTLVDSSATTLTDFGDSLNRGIGINHHPTGSEYNQGKIFNPSVYLGVVPEPATMSLLALGGIAMLRRRKK